MPDSYPGNACADSQISAPPARFLPEAASSHISEWISNLAFYKPISHSESQESAIL